MAESIPRKEAPPTPPKGEEQARTLEKGEEQQARTREKDEQQARTLEKGEDQARTSERGEKQARASEKSKKQARIPEKGKERIRKEKLVIKRNALREKEEKRQERLMERAVKGKRGRPSKGVLVLAEEVTPLIHVQVSEGGRKYETRTSPKMALRKAWQRPNPEELRAIIPGVVLSLSVQEGDVVEVNQELMVYETMKMHNVIRAPFSGTVMQICVKQGDKLPKGALMMVIRCLTISNSETFAPEDECLPFTT